MRARDMSRNKEMACNVSLLRLVTSAQHLTFQEIHRHVGDDMLAGPPLTSPTPMKPWHGALEPASLTYPPWAESSDYSVLVR